MRTVAFAIVLTHLLLVPAYGQNPGGPQRPQSVYVADFVSRSIPDATVLASFTDLFETAFVNNSSYRVLNRRNLQRILGQARNEYVASMRDLPADVRRQIPDLEGAQGVVFGEVTDDIDSGEVVVAVSLESFDSTIHWKHSRSMPRGRMRDLASRRDVMEELASLVTGTGGATSSRDNSGLTPGSTGASRTASNSTCAPAGAPARIPLGLQGGDTKWVARGCRELFLAGAATVAYYGIDGGGSPVVELTVEGVTRRIEFLYQGQLQGMGRYAILVVDQTLDGSWAAISVNQLR